MNRTKDILSQYNFIHMCRNKGYTPEKEIHVNRWKLEETVDNPHASFETSYMQSALTSGIPIIIKTKEGNNISVDAFWGILPVWKHDFKEALAQANNFVNIRSETVYESKLYAPLMKKKQRCLIPCSYYFEHHHFPKYHAKTGTLLKSKEHVPFLVKVNHRPLFAVPALYSTWYNKETQQKMITYSMFTIVANDLMTAVHNGGDNPYRMPLVIERDMEDTWLDPEASEKDINEILNYQVHSEKLTAYPVAPLSGKQAKYGEDITKAQDWGIYNTEIEEIKNAGKEKQWQPATVDV